MTRLEEQQAKYSFLLPLNMKAAGFDCIKDKGDGYYKYINDGTGHYNKDYNPAYPEPKGKVTIEVNINYVGEAFTNFPFVHIRQDGGTRVAYNGGYR